ncbi:MAG: site-specific integrase [Candidatus Marinimicrobia bacterium]|nr:site-specific integrase [Candidatus Neomarinimicrobiota bacterium]
MNKIEPIDLNSEHLNDYINHLRNESWIASWPQIYHRGRREWQYHVKNGDVHHMDWPTLPNGMRSHYALMFTDWPAYLQAIYAEYRKYCTDLFVDSRHHRHRQNQNSANKNLSLMEQLFGFAHRIQGMPIDSLSMDLLFDKVFIYAYYDWMVKDRLGRITQTLETIAGRLLGMANGYFEKPEAVAWLQQLKIDVSGAPVRDKKDMALTMKELKAVADGIRDQGIRELEKAINFGRIPNKRRQARLKMFELMTRLFIHRLLRRSNVCEMMIEKNLIKTDDGHYLIRFGAGEMKGGREYKSSFPPSLVPLLEEFLEDHRPFLCEGYETDYLFPAPTLGHISGDSTLNFLRRHSLRIVGKPLSPHLIRHSVAIEFLKNNPGQSLTLSKMLDHASEKLTVDLYAHFDGLVAADIFDGIMEDDDEETKEA